MLFEADYAKNYAIMYQCLHHGPGYKTLPQIFLIFAQGLKGKLHSKIILNLFLRERESLHSALIK